MRNLVGKRALVTGGAGFIGSHLVEALLKAGAEVSVLDDLSVGRRANLSTTVSFFQMDITKKDEIIRFFNHLEPQIVIHLAAQTSVSRSVEHPQADALINVIGGLNVLEACRNSGSSEHFVFASTGGTVYGEVAPESPADEDAPLNPRSPYAIHKLAFERLLAADLGPKGMRASILRLGNVYGPRQDPHGEAGVVAIFLARMLAGHPVRLFGRRDAGDGGCHRDYIYVSDVVEACLLVLNKRLNGTYNVGTGTTTSTSVILAALESMLGQAAEVIHDAPRPGDLHCSVLDSSRLCAEGWQPRTKLLDGLATTAAWFRAAAPSVENEPL